MKDNDYLHNSPFQIREDRLIELHKALPPNFDSWIHFYSTFKGRQEPIKIVCWSEFIHGQSPKEYEFNIDFVKARCLDEILLLYPQASEHGYYREYSADYVVSRIDKIVGYERPSMC